LVLVAGGLLTAAATTPAAAQSTATTGTNDVALDQYRPSPFSDRVLRLDGTSVMPLGQFRVGLDADYALRPLVLVDQAPGISQVGAAGSNHNLIEHAVSGSLLASVGLGHGLEAGLVVPLTIFQTGDGAPGVAEPSTMGVGNPQVGLKVHLASLGAVGFADDFMKFSRRRNLGLTGKGKLVPQILMALAIAWAIRQWAGHGSISTVVTFPFLKRLVIDLGILYLPFVALIVVGASNAVNLTDGLDGLAIGSVGIAAGTYAILAYVTGNAVVGSRFSAVRSSGHRWGFCGSTAILRRSSWGMSGPFLSAARSPRSR